MKQSRIRGRGSRLSARLVLIALFCGAGSNSASSAQGQVATSTTTSARAPELSSEGQAWLRTAISSGRSDLRWPDFSDYSKHVKKFYESNGDSLWWVKGMEPTAQARQVIALMLQADQKGLSADDYDGSRWSDRLAKLKPATRSPMEADAVNCGAFVLAGARSQNAICNTSELGEAAGPTINVRVCRTRDWPAWLASKLLKGVERF